jgi:hypothetical protein
VGYAHKSDKGIKSAAGKVGNVYEFHVRFLRLGFVRPRY